MIGVQFNTIKSNSFMTSRLAQAIQQIDVINSQDPNKEVVGNESVAKELVYGQRMSACLNQHWPEASEYLKIAVRAQHVKRWAIARSVYPEGKAGYLKWRKALGVMHAETAATLMLDVGYSQAEADMTSAIIRKEKLKTNSDSQALEDVACLVFLTYYFAPFVEKHSKEKIISILQKTWRKMSAKSQAIALTLTLPEHLAKLVNEALG